MAKLVLIRGLPGSGKSTLAKAYPVDFVHCEADDYLIQKGVYKFDLAQIGRAHQACAEKASAALSCGRNVVVSNTFVSVREMRPYYEMAQKLGASFEVIEATGRYKSIHGVSDEVMEKMRAKWEETPAEWLPPCAPPPNAASVPVERPSL